MTTSRLGVYDSSGGRTAVDLLGSREHIEALWLLLQLDATAYVPCDGLQASGVGVFRYCAAVETAIPGVFVEWLGPNIESGPRRFWGHERLRIEMRREIVAAAR